MKISTKSRYAVMAMVDMAQNQGSNPVSLGDIARRQNLPVAYLEQLFVKLRRAKLVDSVRGAQGGYNLARPTSKTAVIDIMAAVDNPIKATRCEPETLKGCQPSGERCATHDLWAELEFVIRGFLSHVTLQEITEGKVSGLHYLFNPPAKVDKQSDGGQVVHLS